MLNASDGKFLDNKFLVRSSWEHDRYNSCFTSSGWLYEGFAEFWRATLDGCVIGEGAGFNWYTPAIACELAIAIDVLENCNSRRLIERYGSGYGCH